MEKEGKNKSFKARCVVSDPSGWAEVGETYDCVMRSGVVLVRIKNRPVVALEEDDFWRCFEKIEN